jgi:hypothetical protein
MSPEELRKLQDIDESLGRPRLPDPSRWGNFFRRNRLLYRLYSPLGADGDAHNVEQLVLPTQLQPAVLKLAHDNYTNGWTSWQEEDSRPYSQSVLLAWDVSGRPGALQDLWSVPEIVDT